MLWMRSIGDKESVCYMGCIIAKDGDAKMCVDNRIKSLLTNHVRWPVRWSGGGVVEHAPTDKSVVQSILMSR